MRRPDVAVDGVTGGYGLARHSGVTSRAKLADDRFAASNRSTTDPVRHLDPGCADAFTIF
jgi:hypothetical protein